MTVDVHSLRSCGTSVLAAAMALDITDRMTTTEMYRFTPSGTPRTVHFVRTCPARPSGARGSVIAPVEVTVSEITADTPCCEDCSDDFKADDPDLTQMVFVLQDVALHRPLMSSWSTTGRTTDQDTRSPSWAWVRLLRNLSRIAEANHESADALRTLIVEALADLARTPAVRHARAENLLQPWLVHAELSQGVIRERHNLDDVPNLVWERYAELEGLRLNGTPEQVAHVVDELNHTWVWVPLSRLDWVTTQAVLPPDFASARSGMVQLPTAALVYAARGTDPLPTYVPRADVAAEDVHAAAKLAEHDYPRLPGYARALTASRT